MIFERGPRAFLDGSFLFMREFVREGSALQHLCHSVSSQISEKITILSSLRYALASFLTQVCLMLFVASYDGCLVTFSQIVFFHHQPHHCMSLPFVGCLRYSLIAL